MSGVMRRVWPLPVHGTKGKEEDEHRSSAQEDQRFRRIQLDSHAYQCLMLSRYQVLDAGCCAQSGWTTAVHVPTWPEVGSGSVDLRTSAPPGSGDTC